MRPENVSRANAQSLRSASCTSRRNRYPTGHRQPSMTAPPVRRGLRCRRRRKGRRAGSPRRCPMTPDRISTSRRSAAAAVLRRFTTTSPSIRSAPPRRGTRAWRTCPDRSLGRPVSRDVNRSLRVTSGRGSPEVPGHPVGPLRRQPPVVSEARSFRGGAPGWCRRWSLDRSSPAGPGAVRSTRTSPHVPGRHRRVGVAHAGPARKKSVRHGTTCPGGATPLLTHVPVAASLTPGVLRSGGSALRTGRVGEVRTRRSRPGRGTRCRDGWNRCAGRHVGTRRAVEVTPARPPTFPCRRSVRSRLAGRAGRPCQAATTCRVGTPCRFGTMCQAGMMRRAGVGSVRVAVPMRPRC